ncbi:hypothetical protein ACIFOT_21045 [Neobacillus sp. NRS-1170]
MQVKTKSLQVKLNKNNNLKKLEEIIPSFFTNLFGKDRCTPHADK